MPKESDLMKRSASRQRPAVIKKRPAPAPKDLSREEVVEQEAKYGVPIIVRVKPETKEAVDRVVAEYNVQKGSLVDFLLRASLYQLRTGRIELPIVGDDGKPKKLILPDL